MTAYRPKGPPSAMTTMNNIARLAPFVDALINHYGASEISAKPHRCFTNPWAMTEGNPFIFIRASDARVSFGTSISRSQIMSDRMVLSIGKREQRMPTKAVPEPSNPGPVGRDPRQ